MIARARDELVGDEFQRLAARNEARARRDFAQADAIRKEIEARGIAIEDTPNGTKWKKVR